MSTIEIAEDEVECAFLGLDVNKGPGPDGITRAILKWSNQFNVIPGFRRGDTSSFWIFTGLWTFLKM
jgi:hypothetical protein